jgi:hypothetical protein
VTALVLRLLSYCLWAALVALAATAEGHWYGTGSRYGEASLVEYLETMFLVLVAALFWIAASSSTEWRGLCTALALVAVVAAIREQDSFFDHNVFDGFWQLLAAAVLGALAWYVYRYPGSVAAEARSFLETRGAGLLLAGFITVFVFSRIIGMQSFWRSVLGDHYQRVVKNFVEEGTELFGYSLLILAAVETIITIRERTAARLSRTGLP